MPGKLEIAQIVGDAARTNDQETARGERRQGLAEAVSRFGTAVALQREWHYWHIGFGEHQAQRHPGTMVEAALLVTGDWQASLGDRLGDFLGGFAATGGWIADLVKRVGKAPEVVDGFQAVSKADGRHRGIPVRTDDDDGARLRQGRGACRQRGTGSARAQGEGGCPVRDK